MPDAEDPDHVLLAELPLIFRGMSASAKDGEVTISFAVASEAKAAALLISDYPGVVLHAVVLRRLTRRERRAAGLDDGSAPTYAGFTTARGDQSEPDDFDPDDADEPDWTYDDV